MPEYPMPKFHFQVQWGGTKIGFTEVTGLDVTTEKIEYRDGASKEYHKTRMPGMQTFGDLTLSKKGRGQDQLQLGTIEATVRQVLSRASARDVRATQRLVNALADALDTVPKD